MRVLLIFLILLLGSAGAQAASSNQSWRIVKDHWDRGGS
jgi:hypothetical protein